MDKCDGLAHEGNARSDSGIGMNLLEERLAGVRTRVAAASCRAGHAVTLVAASKTRSVEEVGAAIQAGQVHFGENYAQEIRDKSRVFPEAK